MNTTERKGPPERLALLRRLHRERTFEQEQTLDEELNDNENWNSTESEIAFESENSEKQNERKSMPDNDITTTEIEPSRPQNNSRDVTVVNPSESSQDFSLTLQKEGLGSMSLIDQSAKQLHGVMTDIIERKKELKDTQRITAEEVEQICNLGTQIRGLLKVKVDALKVAKDLVREARK